MAQITIRCYAELNDFLPPERRQVPFVHDVSGRASVKDVIEALGVPHTEVDLILVNGQPAPFDYLIRGGERISVYPVFESLDISPVERLRRKPLRETRFVLDAHLGKLASSLRLLGFDTLYRPDYDDATLAALSAGDHRILLTRDRGLLKRRAVTHGYYIRADDPDEQLVEVVRRFDLAASAEPFTRCPRCNGSLVPVAKEAVIDQLEPKTRRYYDEFQRCADCGQIYWKGSHYQRLALRIQRLLEHPRANE